MFRLFMCSVFAFAALILMQDVSATATAPKIHLITTATTFQRADGVLVRFTPQSALHKLARTAGLASTATPTPDDMQPCLMQKESDFNNDLCSITDNIMASTDYGMGYAINLDGATPYYTSSWSSSGANLVITFTLQTSSGQCPQGTYLTPGQPLSGQIYCFGAGRVVFVWLYPAFPPGAYTFSRSTTYGPFPSESGTVKPGTLVVDSGNGQQTLTGSTAQAPLVIGMRDFRGNVVRFPIWTNEPKANPLNFTITGPRKQVGAAVSPTFGIPNINGEVSVAMTAGSAVGAYNIAATSVDTTPLSPTATLTAVRKLPPPDNKDKQEGDGDNTCPDGCTCDGGGDVAVADPIMVSTGNNFQQETDYARTGLSILEFKRSYNGLGSKSRLMANYWTTSFDLAVIPPTVAGDPTGVRRPDGRVVPFVLQSGLYQPARSYDHGALASIASGWKYTTEDNVVETYDAFGKWTTTTDPQGRTLTATYNSKSLLTKVTANTGESLTFTYNADNQIATMTDQTGRVWTYTYNGYNNLVQLKYPDGLYENYFYTSPYSPWLLTSISVNRQATPSTTTSYVYWSYDEYGRATTNYFLGPNQGAGGNLKQFSFSYDDTSGNRSITDALGNLTVYGTTTLYGRGFVNGVVGPGFSKCGLADSTIVRDSFQNVLSRTAFGRTTAFGDYDYKGQYGTMVEASGLPTARTTTYQYDGRFIGKPEVITAPSVAPGKSKVTTYAYDAAGNVLSESVSGFKPDGTSVSRSYSFQYDGPYGQLSQINGPRTDIAQVTRFAYDSATNRLSQVTDPNGIVVRANITYTKTGQISAEDRPNGLHIVYAYYPGIDLLQSLTETGSGPSRTTTWTYDDRRRVASLTFSDGINPDQITNFRYDDAGDLTEINSPGAGAIVYTYDLAGNRVRDSYKVDDQPTTAELRWIKRTFDAYGRVMQVVNPYTQASTDFHPDGTLTSTTDGNSNTTSNSYDEFRRLTQTVQPGNIVTSFDYDIADRLTRVTDGNQATTTQAFDDLGDQVSLTSPDTGTTTFAYDAAGDVTASTDALGQATAYTYDAGNRVKTVDRVGVADSETYAYDTCANGVGKLCSATTGAGEYVNYAYDPLGRVASITTNAGVVSYQYDAGGNVTQITYPSQRAVQYIHNASGEVTGVNVTDGGSSYVLARSVTHAPYGPVTGWINGNGLVETRQYDQQYRPTAFATGNVSAVSYPAYDGNSNPTQRTVNGDAQTFGFDTLNRLQSGSGAFGARSYAYDNVGNRTSLIAGTATTNYTYQPQSDRLSLDSNWIYTRDANGNEVQRTAANGSGLQFTYTTHNRLLGVSDLANPQTILGAYRYNALGQRTLKSTTTADTRYVYGLSGELLAEELPNGAVTQEYVYLDGMPLALLGPPASPATPVVVNQTVDSGVIAGCTKVRSKSALNGSYQSCPWLNTSSYGWVGWVAPVSGLYDVSVLWAWGASTQCYDFEDGESCVFNGAPLGTWVPLGRHNLSAGSSSPAVVDKMVYATTGNLDAIKFVLAQTDLTTRDYKYVHTDALGTPLRVTDKNGALVWTATYDPFGAATVNDDPGNTGVHTVLNLRFPGQYFDAESGLYYNYFRDYDPTVGRYVESDPIGLRGGISTFAYVGDSPIRFYDPRGLEGIGIWTYPPGPLRDSYEAAKRGGDPANGSLGIAITGNGIFGLNGEFGVAADTNGNVCVYRKVCTSTPGRNFGAYAGAGLGCGIGQGALSSGASTSNLYVGEGGDLFSAGGGIEVDQNSSAVSVGRGFFGAGEGVFAGKYVCETQTYCPGAVNE